MKVQNEKRLLRTIIIMLVMFAGVFACTSTQCYAKNINKFVTKSGKTYYYGEKGKKIKGKFVKIKKRTYYFDKNGVMATGWKKIKGEYYFFHRTEGKQFKNYTVDGIKINKKGKVKKSEYNVSKIETMIQAREIMQDITDYSDSRKEKLKKCFDWVLAFPYRRYRRLQPIYKTKGWEMDFANDIFDKKAGCCVSEASALAFLLHECGYSTVYVAHDTGHAWTEVNGRIFDTLFAEAKGYSKYFYRSYKGYECHAVDKRKI